MSALDLDGAAPPFCLMPTLPSLPPPPSIPKPASSVFFCLIYLPLDVLTYIAGPVLAALWEVELITLRGSPEVHVKLKAVFCHTGMQTQVQWLVCERELIMSW